ncbi:gag-pol polyprotein [Senna tora]|uniref:Gag-pol polyprotein n=1 Tax=Senna tora TaxID=362788 RepID=A0A834SNU6_9FABA|nr:gag-pol polyprotein [Senna tora]
MMGPCTWTVFVDGSSGRSDSGVGITITTPEGIAVEQALQLNFKTTINQPEYEALIAGLRLAQELGAKQLKIHSDSQLVVGQLNGMFDVKEPTIAHYANSLSKLASASVRCGAKSILKASLYTPSIDEPGEVKMILEENDWRAPLVKYLSKGELPEGEDIRGRILRQASRFYLEREELYRRGYLEPALRCIRPSEGLYILREIHEGICSSHQGPKSLIRKALLSGCYWPNMLTDANEQVKKCEPFQRHANIQHTSLKEYMSTGSASGVDSAITGTIGATSEPTTLFSGKDNFPISTPWLHYSPRIKPSPSHARKIACSADCLSRCQCLSLLLTLFAQLNHTLVGLLKLHDPVTIPVDCTIFSFVENNIQSIQAQHLPAHKGAEAETGASPEDEGTAGGVVTGVLKPAVPRTFTTRATGEPNEAAGTGVPVDSLASKPFASKETLLCLEEGECKYVPFPWERFWLAESKVLAVEWLDAFPSNGSDGDGPFPIALLVTSISRVNLRLLFRRSRTSSI